MIKRWNEKKKITYNTWASYWKSDHWEIWWCQLPLKMVGVCSSLWDQQFWFLNHLILSSYEKIMIETRYQKLRENSDFEFFFLEWMGGNGEVLKDFKRGKKKPTSSCHVASTCGPRVAHVGRGVSSTCGTRGTHVDNKLGQWPCLFLSRTSRVLQAYSGIRTPNSNPFSDYESWLPHAQWRL